MQELIATAVTLVFVGWLYALDRKPGEQESQALWLPLAWCALNGSRPLSEWIHPNAVDPSRYNEGTPIDAVLFGALTLAALLVLNYRWERVRRFLLRNPLLALLCVYCALSILWSDYPFVATKRLVKAAGDVAMALVVLTDADPQAAMRRLFARLSLLLMTLSVVFIFFVPSMGTYHDPDNGVLYFTGVTSQKNVLGQLCLVCGLASLWRLLQELEDAGSPRRTRMVVLHGATLACAAWLVVKADSKTSLVCLAVSSMVMLALSQRRIAQSAGAVHAVVCGAVALAVSAVFLDTASSLLVALGRNPSLTGRTEIWNAVLAAPFNPVLGAGFESFWLGSRLQFVWDTTHQQILQAHNGYLEVFINLGWIGVTLLGALIVYGYRNAILAYFDDRRAGRLGLAFFAAALIFNVTEAGFRIMNLIWFVFLIAVSGVPTTQPTGPLPLAAEETTPTRKMRILQ